MPNVTLQPNTPVELYAASGIAPGTQIRVSNISGADVRLAPSEAGCQNDYVVLNTRIQATNKASETEAWAFSTSAAGVNVAVA